MNQVFYHEGPFDVDEIVSVTAIDGEVGYCDCCDKVGILTRCIVTFDEDRYLACENCGRKVQRDRSIRCCDCFPHLPSQEYSFRGI